MKHQSSFVDTWRNILLFAFTFLILFSYRAIAADDLVFFLEDEPIYTSSDPTSPGFFMEVVLEMTTQMGMTPKIEFLPWKRAQLMAIETPNAVIFPLTRTESREKKYNWICKVFDVPVMFINKKIEARINTIEQARKIRAIGVILGTPQEEFLEIHGLSYITMAGKELYSKLSSNWLDAIYTAKPEALLGWRKGNHDGELQFGQTHQTLPLWIATSKHSDQIDPLEWSKALAQVKRSGYFKQMVEKYFGGGAGS